VAARNERAAILAVVAALIKPQLAILVPIVAVVVIRRALWPRAAGATRTAGAVRLRLGAPDHRLTSIVTTGARRSPRPSP